jgi:hypothetical protein
MIGYFVVANYPQYFQFYISGFFCNQHILSSANKNISAYFLFNGRYMHIIKITLAQELKHAAHQI